MSRLCTASGGIGLSQVAVCLPHGDWFRGFCHRQRDDSGARDRVTGVLTTRCRTKHLVSLQLVSAPTAAESLFFAPCPQVQGREAPPSGRGRVAQTLRSGLYGRILLGSTAGTCSCVNLVACGISRYFHAKVDLGSWVDSPLCESFFFHIISHVKMDSSTCAVLGSTADAVLASAHGAFVKYFAHFLRKD